MSHLHNKMRDLATDVYEIGAHFMSTLGVDYFVYTKSLNHDSIIALSSNATILQQSLDAAYTPPSETWTGLSVPRGIHLASPENTTGTWVTEGLRTQRETFHIDHPLTLINTSQQFVETFTFMANRDDTLFINNALNQLDMFWQFTHYFLDKGKSMIKCLTQTPLTFSDPINQICRTTSLLTVDEKQYLLKRIKPNKYLFIQDGQGIKLSNRQYECLYQLFLGKQIKEIGLVLSLSPTTVQSYLDEVKNKLNCKSRSELITVFLNNICIRR